MPELPEVETIRKGLEAIRRKKISGVDVFVKKIIEPADLPIRLVGQHITAVKRRGKLLILSLNGGNYLLIHLKMTGQLVYRPTRGAMVVGGHSITGVEEVPNKFSHIHITFADKSKLYFNDVRRFGWFKIVDKKKLQEIESAYGPEPLDNQLSSELWLKILATKKSLSIKKVLLDQKLIAGLGNIYVDEACFYTGIRPTRKVSSLKRQQKLELLKNIRIVLNLSIKHGGTSFSNYRQVSGSMGNYIKYLKVYGRGGELCQKCRKTLIKKIKHAGRGTHYCPTCQS